MLGQSFDLDIHPAGYVDHGILRIGAPKQKVPHLVRFQSIPYVLGKVQVVPCIGINRVHDGDSDAAVVPVIKSRKPVRVVTQDHVGPVFADRPDHFAQKRPIGFQFTVGMIEDHEVF